MNENLKNNDFVDDELRGLFQSFNPELNQDAEFLQKLERNMNLLDMAAKYNAKFKKENRLSAALAALGGFVAGVISTLIMPFIVTKVIAFSSGFTNVVYSIDPLVTSIISWVMVGAVTFFTTSLLYTALSKSSTEGL